MSDEQQIAARDPFYDMVPERMWLNLTNIPTEEGKFKVTLEVNGREKVIFNSYTHGGVICESNSLTWLLNPLKAQLAQAQARISEQEARIEKLEQALELIAQPKRADGTYNRSREACEQLAKAALEAEKGPKP